MKRITINTDANGYYVEMNDAMYVYSSVELFPMLEAIGRNLLGRKIRVVEK